jgi:hypothetical protein
VSGIRSGIRKVGVVLSGQSAPFRFGDGFRFGSSVSGLLLIQPFGEEVSEKGLACVSGRSYDCGMGWSFRRSINLGPLRINASKSGFGYSIGGRGFLIGRDAKGRKYTAMSIPGTGIYNRTYSQAAQKTTISPNTLNPPVPNPPSGRSSATYRSAIRVVAYFAGAWAIYALLSAVKHLF